MGKPNIGITFKPIGIGDTLSEYNLSVPINQRSYAWEEEHVLTLLEDFAKAKKEDNPTYFLGTIVLTQTTGNRLEVADGQQRLATVSIFIAAIRDYLYSCGDSEKKAANKYTDKHLLEYDENEDAYIPKLKLNSRDNDFFCKSVLLPPGETERNACESLYASHDRISNAKKIIADYVQKIIAPYGEKDKPKELYQWISFICQYVIVIIIEVPDYINAFTMFETLNDRGLKASQADILKNFLFGVAKKRINEVQEKWASMVSIIENIGDDNLVLTHIRHAWIAKHGPTVERDLASRVKNTIGSMQESVDIVSYLEKTANCYIALLTPLEHPLWAKLGETTRFHIHIISNILKIEQIRPLKLAIAFNFSDEEMKKAFKLLLSISVRFLIYGVSGSGGLEKNYGTIAQDISAKKITKTKEIIPKMTVTIPSDEAFEESFKIATVSKIPLARYYLRAIEEYKRGKENPEYGGVDDTTKFNLEHIMPWELTEKWNIPPEIAAAYQKRLGNMVLLNPQQNVKLGNTPFDEKKLEFAKSTLLTTQEVSNFSGWGPDQIKERQSELAKFVSKIWSLEIK
jgi:hypothetical protein